MRSGKRGLGWWRRRGVHVCIRWFGHTLYVSKNITQRGHYYESMPSVMPCPDSCQEKNKNLLLTPAASWNIKFSSVCILVIDPVINSSRCAGLWVRTGSTNPPWADRVQRWTCWRVHVLWHLAISAPVLLAPYTGPDQASQPYITFLYTLLWLQHNCSGQQKTYAHVWHLGKEGRGDKRDQKKKKAKRRRAKEAKDTMCFYVVSMYDVQIRPELFGTTVRASCSLPADPWLRLLHMWGPQKCLNHSVNQASEEKKDIISVHL